MSRPLDVIVIPRDRNPYQELLYAPMRRDGARIHYAGCLTPSHTINLVLLPAEIVALRLGGYRVVHLHWTFGFHLPFIGDATLVRRACRIWFKVVRKVARRAGLRLVWTAHNTLPHDPVFDDDLAARRGLLADASVVIAHSSATLEELRELGLRPAATRIVPHGPIAPAAVTRLPAPVPGTPRRVLFIGRVERYKGVVELVREMSRFYERAELRVAGGCADPALHEELQAVARDAGNVDLRLGRASDAELVEHLGWADVLAFPFRKVTTSGSVMLGMASGRAIVIPDAPALAEIPEAAAFRYGAAETGLRGALASVVGASDVELRRRGASAREWATSRSWDEIAELTQAAYVACTPTAFTLSAPARGLASKENG